MNDVSFMRTFFVIKRSHLSDLQLLLAVSRGSDKNRFLLNRSKMVLALLIFWTGIYLAASEGK